MYFFIYCLLDFFLYIGIFKSTLKHRYFIYFDLKMSFLFIGPCFFTTFDFRKHEPKSLIFLYLQEKKCFFLQRRIMF